MLQETLRCLCAVCIGASALACQVRPSPSPVNQDRVPIDSTSAVPADYVSIFSPELSNLDLRASGQLKTKRGTSFRWYNYSDLTFNAEAAAATLSYFQEFAPPQGINHFLVSAGREIPISIAPRAGDHERPIFIVPEDAPKPAFWGVIGDNADASTNINANRLATATYIQPKANSRLLPILTTLEAYLNKPFAVEACNQFVESSLIINRQYNYADPVRVAVNAHEAFCGSLGIAFALRQAETSYGIYKDARVTSNFFGFDPLKLDQEGYNKIPKVGNVFTKNP